ncbi:MAG: hypothetical protein ACXVNR_03280 [Bacteroidia bacterium]
MKLMLGGMLSAMLLGACNSSKDAERTPEDHETVMNTSPTFTIPTDSGSTAKKDSVRFPPPTNPDSTHYPPKK